MIIITSYWHCMIRRARAVFPGMILILPLNGRSWIVNTRPVKRTGSIRDSKNRASSGLRSGCENICTGSAGIIVQTKLESLQRGTHQVLRQKVGWRYNKKIPQPKPGEINQLVHVTLSTMKSFTHGMRDFRPSFLIYILYPLG